MAEGGTLGGPSFIATAALLSTVLGIVITTGVRAFPGWDGGAARWIRSFVIVTSCSYALLVTSILYGIGTVTAPMSPLADGDARAAMLCLIVGVCLASSFGLLAVVTDDGPDRASQETSYFMRLSNCVVGFVAGLQVVEAALDSWFDPARTLALWAVMIGLYAGYDAFEARMTHGSERRARLRTREGKRLVRRRDGGGPIVACHLLGDHGRACITRAIGTPQGPSVYLELRAAKELVEWLGSRPLTTAPDAPHRDAQLGHSWVNGAYLTLGGRTRFHEVRAREAPGQRRGTPVGLIALPVDELAVVGIMAVADPAPRRDQTSVVSGATQAQRLPQGTGA